MDRQPQDHHLIRHLIATIAFRLSCVVKDAPSSFGSYEAGVGVRTPYELLCHITGILRVAYRAFEPTVHDDRTSNTWDEEIQHFYETLRGLDVAIQSGKKPQGFTWEQIVQGPLADALTHVGQIATLRRLSGHPATPVSYLRAQIQVGVFES